MFFGMFLFSFIYCFPVCSVYKKHQRKHQPKSKQEKNNLKYRIAFLGRLSFKPAHYGIPSISGKISEKYHANKQQDVIGRFVTVKSKKLFRHLCIRLPIGFGIMLCVQYSQYTQPFTAVVTSMIFSIKALLIFLLRNAPMIWGVLQIKKAISLSNKRPV